MPFFYLGVKLKASLGLSTSSRVNSSLPNPLASSSGTRPVKIPVYPLKLPPCSSPGEYHPASCEIRTRFRYPACLMDAMRSAYQEGLKGSPGSDRR